MSARKTRTTRKTAKPSPEVLPFRLYTQEEIAAFLAVDIRYIQKIRRHGAPFPLGRARLEWVMKWLEEHAMDPELQGKICA